MFFCIIMFSECNDTCTHTCDNFMITCMHIYSDQGRFKKIPVFRNPNGGYGFAPPYEFDSLSTLVLYYATNTMEKHNRGLETTLMYPAFCP